MSKYKIEVKLLFEIGTDMDVIPELVEAAREALEAKAAEHGADFELNALNDLDEVVREAKELQEFVVHLPPEDDDA